MATCPENSLGREKYTTLIMKQGRDEFCTRHPGLALAGAWVNRYIEFGRDVNRVAKSSDLIAETTTVCSYLGLLCLGGRDCRAVAANHDNEYLTPGATRTFIVQSPLE